MKKNRFLRKVFSVLTIFIFYSQNVFAQGIMLASLNPTALFNNSSDVSKKGQSIKEELEISAEEIKIASSFTEHGMTLYQKGDVNGAINDFSRALLLNPHDRKAQGSLIRLALHNEISAKQKVNLYLLEDLLGSIKNLKKRADYFSSKQIVLQKELEQKGHDRNVIIEKMKAIQNVVLVDMEVLRKKLEEEYVQRKDPLEVVNIALGFEREQLANKIAYLQEQHVYLRSIYKVASDSTSESISLNKKLPLNIYAQNFHKIKSELAEGMQPDSLFLEKEVSHVQGQMIELRKQLLEKDEKLQDLSKQLVGFTLELSENKMKDSEKVSDLVSLQKELQDTQSRWELGQRIIQEKEERIILLQKSQNEEKVLLEKHKEALAKGVLIKEKDVDILEEKLKDSNNKLFEVQKIIGKNIEEIAFLTIKSKNFQEKFENNEKNIQGKEQSIEQLKIELQENQKKIAKEKETLEQSLINKTKQLSILKEKFSLFEREVNEVRNSKDEKDFYLTESLQEQDKKLVNMAEQLVIKEKMLLVKNKEINKLEKKLKKNIKKVTSKKEELVRSLLMKEKQDLERKLANKIDQVAFLEGKFQGFDERFSEREEDLDGKNSKITALNRRLDNFQSEIKQKEKMLSAKTKALIKLEKKLKRKESKLIVKKEKEFKKKLSLKEKELVVKNNELEEVRKVLEISKKQIVEVKRLVDEKIVEVSSLNASINSFQIKLNRTKNSLEKKTKKIKSLNGSLVKRKEVKVLEEPKELSIDHKIFLAQEKKLNELNDVLMMYRMGLAEANKRELGDVSHSEGLSNEIVDLKMKIQLEFKKVDAKEKQIQLLKNRLVLHQKEKIEGNQDLRKAFKVKVDQIDEMKETLAMYRGALEDANKEIKEKNVTLKVLNEEVSFFPKNGRNIQNELLAKKDQKLNEMEGILDIYRLKLKGAKETLQENTTNIISLEDQLEFAQGKLFEKNKMLKLTRESLVILEQQLTEVQSHLVNLKTSSRKFKKSSHSKVKEEITDVQSKVKSIHEKLLDQLSSYENIESQFTLGQLN